MSIVTRTITGTRNGKTVTFQGKVQYDKWVRLQKPKYGLKNFQIVDGELRQVYGQSHGKVFLTNVTVS